jgi:hypothetical protein
MLLIYSAPALAGQDWSKDEVTLEVVFLTLQFIDYKQTLAIAEDDDYYETNIFLGEDPQEEAIHAWFALTALGHVAISHMLPSKYRQIWQRIGITIEAGYVDHNNSIGVKVNIF